MANNASMLRSSAPSRRDILKIFAAGMTSAVGTIALDNAPQLNVAQASDGALRIAWLTPAQLDPRSVSGMSEIAILNALYDYLFETDASSNLVPALASSWEWSDDGAQYTLQLVENARFHDGSPLSARDVVWSIQWQLDADGTIADVLAAVQSVEASGEHSVVFQLSAPDPDFLFRLTEYKIVMLKAGAENTGEVFNGTGPFIMEDLIAGDRAIMRANKNYWRGAPTIGRLEFLFFDDQQAAIAAVQGGTADGILRLDNFSFLNFSGDFRFNTRRHSHQRPSHDADTGGSGRRAMTSASARLSNWRPTAAPYGSACSLALAQSARTRPSAPHSPNTSSMMPSRRRAIQPPPPLCWPRPVIPPGWI